MLQAKNRHFLKQLFFPAAKETDPSVTDVSDDGF